MRTALLLVAASLAAAAAPADPLWVGRFDAAVATPPAPWRLVHFDKSVPATRYRTREWDGVAAIEAEADASMALLVRPLEVDLSRTPVLCWRWRIDAPLRTADMAERATDDFAARLYVAFRLPPDAMTWATRVQLSAGRALFGDLLPDASLNYIWDNRYPVGTRRPNAYTDRSEMVVLRSGGALAGRWVAERRNVFEDVQRAFGSAHAKLAMLALATDTDNTGERARAGYADLHFVAADRPCDSATSSSNAR
jgi:hypothetical protein